MKDSATISGNNSRSAVWTEARTRSRARALAWRTIGHYLLEKFKDKIRYAVMDFKSGGK